MKKVNHKRKNNANPILELALLIILINTNNGIKVEKIEVYNKTS